MKHWLGHKLVREQEIHRQILQYVAWRKWIALHGAMHKPTHRTIGEPDFVILADSGKVWFIEVKRPGGKLTNEQKQFREKAARLGHTVHVVYSFDEFHKLVT